LQPDSEIQSLHQTSNIKSADGQPARLCAGIDLLAPARFGLSAWPIYVARIHCGSIRRGEHQTSDISYLTSDVCRFEKRLSI